MEKTAEEIAAEEAVEEEAAAIEAERVAAEEKTALEAGKTEEEIAAEAEAKATEEAAAAEENKGRLKSRISRLLSLGKKKKLTPPPPSGKAGKTAKELWDDGDEFAATQQMIKESIGGIRKENEADEANQEFHNTRNESNKTVWEKHPEVLDVDEGTKKADEVPFYLELQKVYREHPELMYSAKGPVLAMEIAEGRSKGTEKGKGDMQKGAEAEKKRQETLAASKALSAGGGTAPAKKQGKVNLTPDQSLVAGKMGLTDAEYANFSKRQPVMGADYYEKNKAVKRRQ